MVPRAAGPAVATRSNTQIDREGAQMNYLALLPLVALLAACSPGVSREDGVFDACEEYVKSTLKAPATYKRVSADVLMDEGKNRLVMLQYDAENSFGAPLRSGEICAFKLNEKGELPDRDEALFLANGSRLAATLRKTRQYGETAQAASDTAEPEHACCLSTNEGSGND